MKSCVSCKFLYLHHRGYSNYTVMDTDILCALDKNPHLPAPEPWDWRYNDHEDNYPKTNNSRCGSYSWRPLDKIVTLDVEGYNGPADFTDDVEVIDAICNYSGRGPHGGE